MDVARRACFDDGVTSSARGLLVVLEGVDGGGKSTLARGLARALRARGLTVVETKEPTDGPLGQQIRALARGARETISAEEELALFLEDRRRHVADVVRPALARGEVVVQDRSYFSTVAYQGERGLDRARLMAESEAIAPRPDVLLVIDLPADVALARIRAARGDGADDFERLEALARIREVFLGFGEGRVLDGTAPAEAVLAAALAEVGAALRERAADRSPTP